MSPRYATVAELRRAISTEILVAAGLPRYSPFQSLLRPLVYLPAQRFSCLAAEFDRRVALEGWTSAIRWVLPNFVDSSCAHGVEHVPAVGPLLVASNHPGSYDSLAIAANLGRDDLKILVSDVPFFRNMVATSAHMLYIDANPHARMVALRESIRHLRSGGALLVFATGQVDPDPSLMPGSEQSLQTWSSSLAWLLRRVPEARLLVTIVSGVLSPSSYRHPLTRLRKEPRMKQFLAEFIQVSQQLLFGRKFGLAPVVRFGAPVTAAQCQEDAERDGLLDCIEERAQGLLAAVAAEHPVRSPA